MNILCWFGVHRMVDSSVVCNCGLVRDERYCTRCYHGMVDLGEHGHRERLRAGTMDGGVLTVRGDRGATVRLW